MKISQAFEAVFEIDCRLLIKREVKRGVRITIVHNPTNQSRSLLVDREALERLPVLIDQLTDAMVKHLAEN